MKSVTEFANVTLKLAAEKKAALAEGKSPEELATAMGEAMKCEGDKLKHLMNAIEVAAQNPSPRRPITAPVVDTEGP